MPKYDESSNYGLESSKVNLDNSNHEKDPVILALKLKKFIFMTLAPGVHSTMQADTPLDLSRTESRAYGPTMNSVKCKHILGCTSRQKKKTRNESSLDVRMSAPIYPKGPKTTDTLNY
uniref:Uncharacterized protein n=1 Tax=Magallana gigas TaxID=29159 RepID=K1QZY3_MAGGI